MSKMKCYATIEELIEAGKSVDLSYRNLHTPVYIRHTDRLTGEQDTFVIPYKSITLDYMSELRDCIVELPLGEVERTKYRYKPKRMSNDLYGTTELWHALLEANNIFSLIDFTLEKPVKVFEPKRCKTLINEIMILEGVLR